MNKIKSRPNSKFFMFEIPLQGGRLPGGAGVEPMCRKERGTFVSPARAVPQASPPFRFISSFRMEGMFSSIGICVNNFIYPSKMKGKSYNIFIIAISK